MLSRSPLSPSQAGPSVKVKVENDNVPQGEFVRHPGGAHLCYTPMIHARIFSESKDDGRGSALFNLTQCEEGSFEAIAGVEGGDRPLFAQVCVYIFVISKIRPNDHFSSAPMIPKCFWLRQERWKTDVTLWTLICLFNGCVHQWLLTFAVDALKALRSVETMERSYRTTGI